MRLTSNLITDPSLWRLTLRVAPTSLEALLIGPMSADNSVLSLREELSNTSLESAIYDNPLLLSDFKSVQLIVDVPSWTLSPVVDEQVARAMLPDLAGPHELIANDCGAPKLLTLYPADQLHFLHRTFPDAQPIHSMAVALRWLALFNAKRGNRAHVYALLQPDRMQLFAFGAGSEPQLVNEFAINGSAANASYFILAAAADEELPISLGGDPTLRNEVSTMLRTHLPANRILPLTLPSHLLELLRQAPNLHPDLLFAQDL